MTANLISCHQSKSTHISIHDKKSWVNYRRSKSHVSNIVSNAKVPSIFFFFDPSLLGGRPAFDYLCKQAIITHQFVNEVQRKNTKKSVLFSQKYFTWATHLRLVISRHCSLWLIKKSLPLHNRVVELSVSIAQLPHDSRRGERTDQLLGNVQVQQLYV